MLFGADRWDSLTWTFRPAATSDRNPKEEGYFVVLIYVLYFLPLNCLKENVNYMYED